MSTSQFTEPSEKQVMFFSKLTQERTSNALYAAVEQAFGQGAMATFSVTQISRKEMSKLIDALLEQPKANGKMATKKGQAAPASAPAPTPKSGPAVGPDGAPIEDSLIGKIIAIPYADSAAMHRIVAAGHGFATIEKAPGINPDDWTHPLLGNGPTRIEITPGLIAMVVK